MAKKPDQETLDKALETVVDYRSFVRNLTTNMRNNWLRFYEITRLFRVRNLNTINRVFQPLGWEQVEMIAPRITKHDPVYQLIPTKNSAINFTETVADWLMFMWDEKNLRRQARLMVKNGLTYGTSFVKLDMDYITRKETVSRKVVEVEEIEVLNPETGLPETEEVEVEELVEEEIELSALPIFKTLDIFDIDIDPRVECIEDAQGIIQTAELVALSDLYEMEEDCNLFNLDEIEHMAGGPVVGPDGIDKGDKLTERGIPNIDGSSDGTEESKGGVDINALTVREYWGRFCPSDDPKDTKEYVITIVNDALVIRCEENPYATKITPSGVRPFEIYVDSDVPNELYGVGEIEPTETLQIGLSKIKNQRLDNVDLVMNRMWKVERTAGVNPRDLKSYPGNIIEMDDLDGLQAVATPDVTSSSYQEEDRYLRDFQLATGTISAAGGGGRDDFVNTATGQKIRSKEQSSRFGLKIENLEDTLSRIGRKMLLMIDALDDEVFVIRRKDEQNGGFKFTKIKADVLKEAIEGMAVKVKAGSTISDDYEERRNDAIARWNLAVGAFNAGVIGKEELKKTWHEVERVAFGESYKPMVAKGGGLQSLMPGAGMQPGQPQEQLNPNATQINPETLTPNGQAPGVPISPVVTR